MIPVSWSSCSRLTSPIVLVWLLALVHNHAVRAQAVELFYDLTIESPTFTVLEISGVAAKPNGNLVIGGSTFSGDLSTNPVIGPLGETDWFIAEIDTSRSGFVWSTYFGSSTEDILASLTVDTDGNVYAVGTTRAATDGGNDLILVNPIQNTFGGDIRDAAVAKFDSDGNLLFSTFFGGSGNDYPQDIEVGPGGEIVIAGYTTSSDFPTAGQLSERATEEDDVFVSTLMVDGTVPFSTTLGGSDQDRAWALSVTNDGTAWVTGETYSRDFPTVDATDDALDGSSDAFIFAISGALSGVSPTVAYSSFYGGGENDIGLDLALDASGAVFAVGRTNSPDLPIANATQEVYGTGIDAFVMAVSPTRVLALSTYQGEDASDRFNAVRTLGPECVFAVGTAANESLGRWYCLDGSSGASGSVGNLNPVAMVPWRETPDRVDFAMAGSLQLAGSASNKVGRHDGEWASSLPTIPAVYNTSQTDTVQGRVTGGSVPKPRAEPTTALQVTKRMTPSVGLVGETVQFEIEVTNVGDVAAENVVVEDNSLDFTQLPLRFRRGFRVRGVDKAWQTPSLAPGSSETYELSAIVSWAGEISNVATASANNATLVSDTAFASGTRVRGDLVLTAFLLQYSAIINGLGPPEHDAAHLRVDQLTSADVYIEDSLLAPGILDMSSRELAGVSFGSDLPTLTVTRSGASLQDLDSTLAVFQVDMLHEVPPDTYGISNASWLFLGYVDNDSLGVVHKPGLRPEASDPAMVDLFAVNLTPLTIELLQTGVHTKKTGLGEIGPLGVTDYISLAADALVIGGREVGNDTLYQFQFDLSGLAGQAAALVAYGDREGAARLALVRTDGVFTEATAVSTAVESADGLTNGTALGQAYPNPFRSAVSFDFTLTQPEHVSATIYDLRGRLVRTIDSANYAAGTHTLRWIAEDNAGDLLPSGTYLMSLAAGQHTVTRTATLVR